METDLLHTTNKSRDLNKNHKSENDPLIELYYKTRKIKRIRLILNELLCNGAYSTKNLETQMIKFDKLNVPQWEKDIVLNAYKVTKKQSHKLLKELNAILDDIKKDN